MYRLTVDNVEHYLVVMRNVFSNHLKIHKKYDLKGSTVDREASQKEREKDSPTFKDMDFLNDKVKIHIGDEAKARLMDTLRADVTFLTSLHLMDYSLLLGESKFKTETIFFADIAKFCITAFKQKFREIALLTVSVNCIAMLISRNIQIMAKISWKQL